MGTEIEEDDTEEEEMIVTSKLQLVLAAKSRKLQYTSSPVISHHVSLSLLSPPDDLSHSRASVPFSWEEEPGKPKQHTLLLRGASHDFPKPLHLPPRLPHPNEVTKMLLASDDPHHLAAALKQYWFRWKKDRSNDDDVTGKCSFSFSADNVDDKKITRTTSSLYCLSDVATCYLWEMFWKKKKLKSDDVFINCY